jgi:hypothetical protein
MSDASNRSLAYLQTLLLLGIFTCFAEEKPLAKAHFSKTLEMLGVGGGMEKNHICTSYCISGVKGCNSSVFDGFLQGLPDDFLFTFTYKVL